MKLHRLTRIGIVLLLTILVISACDSDYDRTITKRGVLNFNTFFFEPNGIVYFEGTTTLPFDLFVNEDIQGVNLSIEDLVDFRIYKSLFVIDYPYFRDGDIVDITLVATGMSRFSFRVHGRQSSNGEIVINIRNVEGLHAYMYDMIDELLHRGSIELDVTLSTNIRGQVAFYFGVENQLDFKVLDHR